MSVNEVRIIDDNGTVEIEVDSYTGEGYETSYHEFDFCRLERIYLEAVNRRKFTHQERLMREYKESLNNIDW